MMNTHSNMKLFVLTLLCLILLSLPTEGIEAKTVKQGQGSLNDNQVIRAIIGEASNQGFQGMYAVASAIINRGTLKGVYGANAKHVDTEPTWVWEMATRAWYKAKGGTLAHSGDHWGSKIVDKAWIAKMEASDKFIKVYEYKDHIFYKEAIK